jgi:hypothetical protein
VCWGLNYVLGRQRCALPFSGSCEIVRQAARRRGMIRQRPQYGAIGLLISTKTGRAHHAFLCTSDPRADGSVTTIEGNTNDDGSPEGIGVFERVRGGAGDPLTYEYIDPAEI